MSKQRLYIDESGDHTVAGVTPASWDKRYLCLFGCSLDFDYCLSTFQQEMDLLKKSHFPDEMDEPVILHREETCAKSGVFRCLKNPEKNKLYQDHLLKLINECRFRAFAVVIDKLSSQNRYYGLVDSNPYHISLALMLERYCGWLKFTNQTGDVMAESRGAREDKQLKAAYQAVCSGGTSFRVPEFFTRVLTSKEIKVKPKIANIAGLQLSDQLAYAAKRRILEEQNRAKSLTGFEGEIAMALEGKYNRHFYNGRISGYGKVFVS